MARSQALGWLLQLVALTWGLSVAAGGWWLELDVQHGAGSSVPLEMGHVLRASQSMVAGLQGGRGPRGGDPAWMSLVVAATSSCPGEN